MKLYYAPLEGITTYTYRNLHREMFGGCDAYFAPFISPTDNEALSRKTMRDILPEHNDVPPKVQCLASSETAFIKFTQRISDYGYTEVNLNLGCPSGTVVKKNRGAGAFRDMKRLETFLDYIFRESKLTISIKTRAGFADHSEFRDILALYEKYPISELIVHPRVREDYYRNEINRDSFTLAHALCKTKLCYNGDIITVADYQGILESYPDLNAVMIGRGAVKNPALFREIKGGAKLTTEELVAFSRALEKRYLPLLQTEKNVLHKLKEIWLHMTDLYPGEKKILKAIKKANSLGDINNAIDCLPELS